MGTVVELFADLHDTSFYMIYRQFVAENIIGCDENHIGFRQLCKVITGFQLSEVEHIAVIPGSLRVCTAVGILHFKVVFATILVCGKHIKADTAPVEVGDTMLGLDLQNLQVSSCQDDIEDVLHGSDVVVHEAVEENIIHECHFLDCFDQFLPVGIVDWISQSCHHLTPFLFILYHQTKHMSGKTMYFYNKFDICSV